MKIKAIVPNDHIHLNLVIPNALIMNRVIFHFICKSINRQKQLPIDEKQLYRLTKALKDSKKIFGNYDLVDIESKGGEIIKIRW